MANVVYDIKKLGWVWDDMTKNNFSGAIQGYKSSLLPDSVNMIFTMHEAYIVEDDQGLFGSNDLLKGVIENSGVDSFLPSMITGAFVVAEESNGVVEYDDQLMDRLGINDFSIKMDIEKRLLELSKLDIENDFIL